MTSSGRPDLTETFGRVKNWGRWGADDRKGTLNFLTPQRTLEALALVQTGRTVALGRALDTSPGPRNPRPVQHTFYATGVQHVAGISLGHVDDHISLRPHGRRVTHLDALSHFHYDGQHYGGRPYRAGSLPAIGVDDLAEGLVTRGVLLDLPRSLAVRWLEPGHAIRYAELERAERESGVNVSEGDAVLVRTGRDDREARTAPSYHEQAGFHPDAMIWAHERKIALFGSDGSNECDPPIAGEGEWPAHVLALVAMGLPLVDNAFLEELAGLELAKFAFVLAPAALRGGTSSPVNPLALV